MNELLFSKKYYVRKLQKNDIDQIMVFVVKITYIINIVLLM